MLEREKAGAFNHLRCLRTIVSAALVCLLFLASTVPFASGQCSSGPSIIVNGGFEDDLPEDITDIDAWDPWVVDFDVFFPICADGITCPSDATYFPRTGVGWILVGFSGIPETASVGQGNLTTGPGPSVGTLRFFMKTVAGPAPADFTLDVVVDGLVRQTFTITETEPAYSERTVSFVLAPGTHTVAFEYESVADPNEDFDSAFMIDDVTLNVCAVTATTASLSGRVLAFNGRGVANTPVTLTNQFGVTRTALTNSFGYYRFDDVPVGLSYVLQPVSSRFIFSPQVITLDDDLEGVNFVSGR